MANILMNRRGFLKRAGAALLAAELGVSCRGSEKKEIFREYFPGLADQRVRMKTGDIAFQTQMFNRIYPTSFNEKKIQLPFVKNVTPFLPLFNAAYFDVTGTEVPDELYHIMLCEDDKQILDRGDIKIGGIYASGHIVQIPSKMDIRGWKLLGHEAGHAYDHFSLNYGKKEFTSELMDLFIRCSLEKNRPPLNLIIENNLSKRIGFNFITDGWERNPVREVWEAYESEGKTNHLSSDGRYRLGRINKFLALAEGGNLQDAWDNNCSILVHEMEARAESIKTRTELGRIIEMGLDVIEEEFLRGPYGKKRCRLVNPEGEQIHEIDYVPHLMKYLRDHNMAWRDSKGRTNTGL